MNPATLLSWVLAAAPESPPRVVEVEHSPDSVQITARDDAGDVAAELFVWTDADGRTRLDATWPDGLYLSVSSDGESSTVDTEDAEAVATRLEQLGVALEQGGTEIPQWLECAGSVVLAGAACVPPLGLIGFLACTGATTAAGCACLETATKGGRTCWD